MHLTFFVVVRPQNRFSIQLRSLRPDLWLCQLAVTTAEVRWFHLRPMAYGPRLPVFYSRAACLSTRVCCIWDTAERKKATRKRNRIRKIELRHWDHLKIHTQQEREREREQGTVTEAAGTLDFHLRRWWSTSSPNLAVSFSSGRWKALSNFRGQLSNCPANTANEAFNLRAFTWPAPINL